MSITRLADLCKEIYYDDVLEKGFHHYYLDSENTIVISGTNSLSDWWHFNFRIVPLTPFHYGLGCVAGELFEMYGPYIDENTKITGHSAGGIIAIALAELANIGSITFGSCLMKNRNYLLKNQHTIINNKFDPINLLSTNDPNLVKINLNGFGHKIETINPTDTDQFYFG